MIDVGHQLTVMRRTERKCEGDYGDREQGSRVEPSLRVGPHTVGTAGRTKPLNALAEPRLRTRLSDPLDEYVDHHVGELGQELTTAGLTQTDEVDTAVR